MTEEIFTIMYLSGQLLGHVITLTEELLSQSKDETMHTNQQ